MCTTINADSDKVIQAYKEAKPRRKKFLETIFDRKVFQPNVRDRINNFDDILRENNMTKKQYEALIKGLSSDSVGYESCKLIVNAYNEGIRPDYNNTNQKKYSPRFQLGSSSGPVFSYLGCGSWRAYSLVGSRLDYLDYDNMVDAVTKFLPQYEQLITT